jgi:hypothetical protein
MASVPPEIGGGGSAWRRVGPKSGAGPFGGGSGAKLSSPGAMSPPLSLGGRSNRLLHAMTNALVVRSATTREVFMSCLSARADLATLGPTTRQPDVATMRPHPSSAP